MEKRKLDDEEAYHFKRRQAMNPPISIGVVAAAVIDSHDILG
jgi:AmiR/NasT family two-component response regulator